MKTTILHFLKKRLILSLVAAFVIPYTALASFVVPGVQITDNEVSQETFTISYCLTYPADVTVGIYEAVGSTGSKKVDILEEDTDKSNGCYTVTWDGKNGEESEIGIYGEIVPDGQYFYGINASGVYGKSGSEAYVADWITVDSDPDSDPDPDPDPDPDDKIRIREFDIENSTFDPWDGEEVEFTFILNKEAEVTLEIRDDDGDLVKKVVDDKVLAKGEHTLEWDGEDDDDDIVDEDEYEYKLTAWADNEKDTEKGEIEVEKDYDNDHDETTIDPRLKNVYITKDTFDPGFKEKVNFVFTLTAEADVEITIYKDDEKIEEIYDKKDLEEGTHVIEWDGDEVVNDEGTYTYKITAENSKGDDEKTGEFKIEEDQKSNRKPNIFRDKADKYPFFPKNETLSIEFTVDKESDVSLEIRDGDYVIAEVLEDVNLLEGKHYLGWDGKDKYGEYVEDGVYSYKLIAANNKGKDVENGFFSVEDSSNAKYIYEGCGSFSDVDEGYKYCEAIRWSYENKIFSGYSDGTFRPNQPINRVEAIKVILELMDIKIADGYGSNFGFPDVDRYAWYIPYLSTALSLGVVNGYDDGYMRPDNLVVRVEALVMLLNTGKAKDCLVIPTNLYGQPYYDTPNELNTKWYISYTWFARNNNLSFDQNYFYPDSYMTRGEMADMIYRYYQAGLCE